MKSYKIFIGLAALLGLAAVVIGALSAHAIERGLTAEAMQQIDTALKYQFIHLTALFGVGILASLHRNFDSVTLKISGIAFFLGILFFSGSLYAYAFSGNDLFAKFTPMGGVCFMLGWLFLFFFSLKR